MPDPFIEIVPAGGPNALKLRCPNCEGEFTLRRDSVAVGLHQITCKHYCGHRTDAVKLHDGQIVEKDAAAFRGGGA